MSRTLTVDWTIDARRRRETKLFGRTLSGSSLLKRRFYVRAGQTTSEGLVLDVSEIAALVLHASRPLTLVTNGANEIQRLTVDPSAASGSFDLTFGFNSASIDWDATAPEVETALEGITEIGSGNVSCSGGPFPASPIDVEFVGSLANLNVQTLTVTSNTLLDGGATPLPDPDVDVLNEGGGPPGDTISLLGNRPEVWTPSHWDDCPFTVDVSTIRVTNSTSHSGRLILWAFS